jgi:cell wall assembly regulator SMI1
VPTLTTVRAEFERLSRVYERLGYPIKKAPPASDAQLASLYEITGIDVDDTLKELWRISNGSRRYAWFAKGDDWEFTHHIFLPIKEVLESWTWFAPYDEKVYAEWHDDESWGKRDPRIQRHFLRHRQWLPFSEFNGGSEQLQFDADPTALGRRGQIILYSHDPDAIFWKAGSFLEFFQASNNLLEEWAKEPDLLIEELGLLDSAGRTLPGLLTPESCHPVEFNFDGMRVTWLESEKGRASESHYRRDPDDPTKNTYRVHDPPLILRIDRGNLIFDDDGLEFEFGTIGPRDHIRIAGYNEIYVNDERRAPLEE